MQTNNSKKEMNIRIVKKMKDYSKEPFFQKKLEDATRFIKKNGIPKAVQRDN